MADLVERLKLMARTLSEPWEMPTASDLMREAADHIAALEAEASEGERRGMGEPVAWQVKSVKGGWRVVSDEVELRQHRDWNATLRPLYAMESGYE